MNGTGHRNGNVFSRNNRPLLNALIYEGITYQDLEQQIIINTNDIAGISGSIGVTSINYGISIGNLEQNKLDKHITILPNTIIASSLQSVGNLGTLTVLGDETVGGSLVGATGRFTYLNVLNEIKGPTISQIGTSISTIDQEFNALGITINNTISSINSLGVSLGISISRLDQKGNLLSITSSNTILNLNSLGVSLGISISNNDSEIDRLGISSTNTISSINSLGVSLGISINTQDIKINQLSVSQGIIGVSTGVSFGNLDRKIITLGSSFNNAITHQGITTTIYTFPPFGVSGDLITGTTQSSPTTFESIMQVYNYIQDVATAIELLYGGYIAAQTAWNNGQALWNQYVNGYQILNEAEKATLQTEITVNSAAITALQVAVGVLQGQVVALGILIANNTSSINTLGVSSSNIDSRIGQIGVSVANLDSDIGNIYPVLSLLVSITIPNLDVKVNTLGVSSGVLDSRIGQLGVSVNVHDIKLSLLGITTSNTITNLNQLGVSTGVSITNLNINNIILGISTGITTSNLNQYINQLGVSLGITTSTINQTLNQLGVSLGITTTNLNVKVSQLGTSTSNLESNKLDVHITGLPNYVISSSLTSLGTITNLIATTATIQNFTFGNIVSGTTISCQDLTCNNYWNTNGIKTIQFNTGNNDLTTFANNHFVKNLTGSSVYSTLNSSGLFLGNLSASGNSVLGTSSSIGIGTTASYNFKVSYNSDDPSFLGTKINQQISNLTGEGIVISQDYSWYANSFRHVLRRGGSTNINRFGLLYNNAEYMSVLPTGQIGIGISNPSYTLDVFGDINSSTSIKINGNSLGTSIASVDSKIGNLGVSVFTIGLNVSGVAKISTLQLQANAWHLDSLGNNRIYLQTTGSNVFYYAADTHGWRDGSSNNDRMNLSASGLYVGGSTNSAYKLEVLGDINATNKLRIAGNDIGVSFSSNSTSINLLSVSSGANASSINALGVSLGVSISNGDSRIGQLGVSVNNLNVNLGASFIQNNANTLPVSFITSSLKQLGSSCAIGIAISGNYDFVISRKSDDISYFGTQINKEMAITTGEGIIVSNDYSWYFNKIRDVLRRGNSTNISRFSKLYNNTELTTWTLDGRFGIGITNPSVLLDVSGNIRAQDSINTQATYRINNVDVINSTTLGSGIVSSSLTSLGTLTTLNTGAVNITSNTSPLLSMNASSGNPNYINMVYTGSGTQTLELHNDQNHSYINWNSTTSKPFEVYYNNTNSLMTFDYATNTAVRVGINQQTPSATLDVNGTCNVSGLMSLGATNGTYTLNCVGDGGIRQTNNGTGFACFDASANNTSFALSVYNANTQRSAGTSCKFFQGTVNGTSTINIFNNGSITNSTGSYGTISDEKVKRDIKPAKEYTSEFLQLKFKTYIHRETEEKCFGLIAQDVEKVWPNLVEEHQWTNNDLVINDIIPEQSIKSIKSSIIYMIQGKVLQETILEVEKLKKQVKELQDLIN